MSPFQHQEPPNPSKRCKCLASTLKDALSNCHAFRGRLRMSPKEDPQEDGPASDFDVEEEVFVSAIINKYMESKCKRQASHTTDSFYLAFSPATGDLFITEKAGFQQRDNDHEEKEDFFDADSHFSCCSSAASMETFISVKTSSTRCSSLYKIDFPDIQRLSIIEDLRNCEGWPFGLCKKALLLPPPPKSPSDSWSWHKRTRTIFKTG